MSQSNPAYEPVDHFIGKDSFTYTITDSNGLSSTANVNLVVKSSVNLPGWRFLTNFGLYFEGSTPWVQHEELDWIFVPEARGEDNATWMWSADLGWFWTGDEHYPSIYLQEFEAWYSISKDISSGKWLLYDYSSAPPSWLDMQTHMVRRLQAFLKVATNSASAAAVIDRFTGLSREDRDVIISELLILGHSKTLTAMGISLGF